MKKSTMPFEEILADAELYRIVENIEHGSSDPENIKFAVNELYEKTGYKYEI